MYLDKYIMGNGCSTNYPIFEDKISVMVNIPTNDLFLAQYYNNDFNAVDVVVKYLAIENYFGLNQVGFSIYEQMQQKRINENWNERFKLLINSVEKRGYLENFPIQTDVNYSIHDGAHRLALALFLGIKNVNVEIFNVEKVRRSYTLAWFKEYKFTQQQLEIIKTKLQELLEKCRKPYYCIFWPPARNIFDSLGSAVEKVENGIQIIDSKTLSLPCSSFKNFIYDVYATDDIRIEKLNLKYQYLMNSLALDHFKKQELPLQVLKIKINNPDFRMKTFTGLPQSKTTMRIKKKIRNDFSEQITEYYYDIIMHMTDNTIQNEDVEKILKRVKEL